MTEQNPGRMIEIAEDKEHKHHVCPESAAGRYCFLCMCHARADYETELMRKVRAYYGEVHRWSNRPEDHGDTEIRKLPQLWKPLPKPRDREAEKRAKQAQQQQSRGRR